MLGLTFNRGADAPYHLICLGAHSDDIEIGCGGTLLKLSKLYPNLKVHWIVFSATPERAEEARRSAENFLVDVTEPTIVVKDFPDGFFPTQWAEIKQYFEQLKAEIEPDLILTHYRHDLHQDHRVLCDLTWNTWRNHLILEYEIPKYDGDLGIPNVFVQLDAEQCQRKIDYLLAHFQTQANKHWFTDETFRSLMRIRGIESKAPDGYAEAFYGRKIML